MTDEQRQALAARVGLDPATATEDDIYAAALAAPDGTPDGADPVLPAPDPAVDAEPVPAGVAASTATVSRDVLERLERDAAVGVAAQARQVHGDRDRLILAALEAGRITPAESGLGDRDPATGLYAIADTGWRRYLEDAPEVTARALEGLEAGKYPGSTAARGVAPQGGRDSGSLARVLATVPGLNRSKVKA